MRFLKTGKIREGLGCFKFSAGERFLYSEVTKPELQPGGLIKLNNNRTDRGRYEGFFLTNDLLYIGVQE